MHAEPFEEVSNMTDNNLYMLQIEYKHVLTAEDVTDTREASVCIISQWAWKEITEGDY